MKTLRKRLEELERRAGGVGLQPSLCLIEGSKNGVTTLQIKLWDKRKGEVKDIVSFHPSIAEAHDIWEQNYKSKSADIPVIVIDV